MKTLTRSAVAGLLLCQALVPAHAQQRAAKSPAKTAVASAKPKPVAAHATAPKAQPSVAQAAPQREAASVAQAQSERPQAQPAAPSQRTSYATRPKARASSSGSKYLNVGIGLAAYGAGGLPIGASLEVDLKNNISVGGFVDYARYGYNNYGYKWNYTFIYLGARASYHASELLGVANPRFDPYAGLSLGYRSARYSDHDGYYGAYSSPYASTVFIGAHVGARYLFSDKIGGFAEVGYGVAALKVGLTAKL